MEASKFEYFNELPFELQNFIILSEPTESEILRYLNTFPATFVVLYHDDINEEIVREFRNKRNTFRSEAIVYRYVETGAFVELNHL